jgi:hypothetical protein
MAMLSRLTAREDLVDCELDDLSITLLSWGVVTSNLEGDMTVPEHEMSRELVNLLVRNSDLGHSTRVSEVQEELGVGHDDALAMLDQLRGRGMASEVAPDEWETGTSITQADEPVRVTVPEEIEEEPSGWQTGTVTADPALYGPQVRLTRSIADALSDEALGQIVKAGLGDVAPGEAFFLMVL